MTSAPVRTTAWVLLLGLFACYLALAPGTVEGRGYVGEDMKGGMSMLAAFNAWVKGRPPVELYWSRHGPVPLLLDLPFLKLGKLFVTPDFMLSAEPVLLTAGLLTIVYLWLTRLCSPGMSLLITLIGAFGTMLWPYAYIGLETKQSFFVLLAGYLALANGRIRTWPRVVFFAVISALAITTKATGVVLAPAIVYLVYAQFRDGWRSRWLQGLVTLVVIGGIWALAVIGWSFYWNPRGGGGANLQGWMIDSKFQIFTNVIGLFGSPGKGIFVFAPVLLLSVYGVVRGFRVQRDLTIFALLVTVCTVGFLSLLIVPADELWGPRFMHVTVAPLLVVIGAACPRFRWGRDALLIGLGLLGFAVSFLGAFYYYGARGWAASAAGQNTLEWFAGDHVWNEVEFDARIFRVWLKGGSEPAPWTPAHVWAWTAPPEAQPWKTVNLRDYAEPQSFLLQYWRIPLTEKNELLILRICLISLVVGPLLLTWVVARTIDAGAVSSIQLYDVPHDDRSR